MSSATSRPTILGVVADCRAEVEALIGQPLPGTMVEVSDPAAGPMVEWLNRRLREL